MSLLDKLRRQRRAEFEAELERDSYSGPLHAPAHLSSMEEITSQCGRSRTRPGATLAKGRQPEKGRWLHET